MKNKHKKKLKIITLTLAITGFYLVAYTGTIATIAVINFFGNPVNQFQVAEILIPSVQAEPTMKEWVLNYVESQGLDRWKIDQLIDCESGWNNWAYGINTNGSTDFSLWQINSIHKNTISVECRWDYKCSTKWAVEKIKRDKGIGAWVCSKNIK